MGWIRKISWGLGVVLFIQPLLALNIQFSKDVPANQADLVRDDLALLSRLQWSNNVVDLNRIFKADPVDARTMENWLGQRVSYLLDQKHPLDMSTIRVVAPQAMGLMRLGHVPSAVKTKESVGTAILRNIGVEIYSSSKLTGSKLGLDVQGQGFIEISSPRVGLIQMFHAFFLPLSDSGLFSDVGEIVNRIYRLSNLFHEGRHSDGKGDSLGFRHVNCPAGHVFAGLPACDAMANGAYRIQALVLESIEKGCETCSLGQKDALKLMRADSLSRILSPLKPEKILQPETAMQKLCALQRQLGQNIALCEDILTNKPVEWDETPEGQLPQGPSSP